MSNIWGGKRAGAGRPRGARDKLDTTLRERMKEQGADPAEVLAEIMKTAKDEKLRRAAASDLMPYLYPRLSVQNIDLGAAVDLGPLVIVRHQDDPSETEQATDEDI